MKTLSKIRLTQMSKTDLAAREMNFLKGGYDGGCDYSCTGYSCPDGDADTKKSNQLAYCRSASQ